MNQTRWLKAAPALLLAAAGLVRAQAPTPAPAASEPQSCSDKNAPCCTKPAVGTKLFKFTSTATPAPGTSCPCDEGCKVADLLHKYQALYKEGKYAEAESCARAAFEIAPDNAIIGAAIKVAHIQKLQTEYKRHCAQAEALRYQREAFAEQLKARFQEYIAGHSTLEVVLEAQRNWEAAVASEHQADGPLECEGPCCVTECVESAAYGPKCAGPAPCCTMTANGAPGCVKCGTDCSCCPKCSGTAAACACNKATGCKCCADCCEAAGSTLKSATFATDGCRPCDGAQRSQVSAVVVVPLPPPAPLPMSEVYRFDGPQPVPAYPCPLPGPFPAPAVMGTYPAQPYPVPVGAPMPPPVIPCSMAMPVPAPAPQCLMKVVTEEGKSCLEVVNGGETQMTCDSLMLKVPGSSPLSVTVAGKQVQLSSHCLKASADRVARPAGEECLILEGNVRLDYHKDGKHTETTADRVVVGLADGSLEIESAATADPKAAHHASDPEDPLQQMLGYWLGTFR
jgi:hypothetical protein